LNQQIPPNEQVANGDAFDAGNGVGKLGVVEIIQDDVGGREDGREELKVAHDT
jgi:hypothetical protein